jgi:hypothetical protein
MPGCSSEATEEAAGGDRAVRSVLPAGDRSTLGGNRVIGTIEATFDGQPRTWYVLEADANGERHSGAFWYEPEPGAPRMMIVGYDSPDVPFHTFGRPGAPTGDYDGSAITLIVALRPGEAPGSIRLPADDETGVLYMPSAVEGPLYGISDGRIDVTTLDAPRSGEGQVSGTFRGTMGTPPRFDQTFAVTDGRFEVKEVKYQEGLTGVGEEAR